MSHVPAAFLGGRNLAVAELEFGLLGFAPLVSPQPDRVAVPPGYTAEEIDPRDAVEEAASNMATAVNGCAAVYGAEGAPDAHLGKLVGGDRYIARFSSDRTGEWRALAPDGSDFSAGADRVGGTRVARPRCVALHPITREIYVALTSVPPGASGPIVRCLESGSDPAATTFRWSSLRLSGDARAALAPHGLWFDGRGVLWIKTDVLLAADPVTGHVRRFLSGPRPAAITAVVTTQDARSMFVTIQRGKPGPGGSAERRRATLRIRKSDGGVVGS